MPGENQDTARETQKDASVYCRLDILEFLMALEEELDVEVSGDVETIKTMQDVVDCVMRSFPH